MLTGGKWGDGWSAAAQIAERFLSAAVVSTKDLLMMRFTKRCTVKTRSRV